MDRPRLVLWFDSVAEGGVITLVDWPLRTPSAQSISDLQLWRQGRSEFVACENILESLGPSLEHFQLSLDCRSEDGVLKLAHNSNLQTLSMRNVEASMCDHVPILLHHISSYQIRDISFHVSVEIAAELETYHSYWTELGSILERAQFRKLQRITMWWCPSQKITVGFCDFVQVMEGWLHDLGARRLLRVSDCLK
ncbi:hypothetical protein A0H81_12532 [Grifola frondosa]|uniref:Uncharacterized protein n=1 Tax=Grifola frondosa TaxID=5627 RepID=A0A1C7LRJ0_GRIFR|nr:hypothetical protein A0H81_12532 [Grifola frondosa]